MKTRVYFFAALLLLILGSLLLPDGQLRQGAAFALLWLAPAYGLARLVPGPAPDDYKAVAAGARLLHGLGLAPLVTMLLTLFWHYVPGPIPVRALPLTVGAVAALLALPGRGSSSLRWNSSPSHRGQRRSWAALGALLLVAGVLRFGGLSYKEFQGDEGIIMVRAAAMITGDDAEIFLHQKGPVEILLPMAQWLAGGRIGEFWARAPFAWASLLSVLSITWLGYQLYARRAGIWAGLLFAVSGFSIAFGHIVQYQSFVMLWTLLALSAALSYARQGKARFFLLAPLFLAAGLLAHYDAILFAPAVAWLLLARGIDSWRSAWRSMLGGLLVAAGVLALFYVPYVLHPNFARTGQYLLGDRIGAGAGSWLTWSGPAVWQMATFYVSTYMAAGIVLLALLGLRPEPRGTTRLPVLLFALAPMFVYLLVVVDARTHVYTLFPGLTLLAAGGIDWLSRRLPPIQPVLHGIVGLLVAVGGLYGYLMFVDHTPERQRNWETARPSGFPFTWRETPRYGLFGFPYQAGWRLAADLVGTDSLYASNEEEEITNWYMAQAPRTHCPNDEVFLLAADVQDNVAYKPEQVETKSLRYVITVAGEEKLRVFTAMPVDEVVVLGADDARLTRAPEEVAHAGVVPERELDTVLGERIRLLGYDIDERDARPGGQLVVTLYWEALAPVERNYQAFVHLYDGEMRGQYDSAPECGINPTTRWEPGQIVPDPHIVPINPDTPVTSIPVLAGMYDLVTSDRLIDAETGADVIQLTEIQLQAP